MITGLAICAVFGLTFTA